MPERCLLDLDGVCVDFIGGACAFHGVANPYEAYAGEQMGYEVSDLVGMSRGAFYGPLGEEFWAHLEPTDEFREVVEMVEARFGDRVFIATSPVKTRGCYEGKLRWLEKHLPGYFNERKFLVGPPKWAAAGPDAWLLDDSDKNVDRFTHRDWGGNAFLFPRPWNKNHRHANRPLCWLEDAIAQLDYRPEV